MEQPIQSSVSKQAAAMNLNQLPEANSTKLPFTVDINSLPTEPLFGWPGSFRETMKLEESEPAPSDLSSVPTAVEPVQIPVTDVSAESLLVSISGGVPAFEAIPLPNPVPMPTASSPVPDVAHVSMPAPTAAIAPVPAAPLPEQMIIHLEEKLMAELKGLGFTQADLNKQILRQNNYDLEQSVVDLCGYNEWDALEEFSELVSKNICI